MDLEAIKHNYAQMENFELIKLANEIEKLKEEVIPILKKELLKRNETLIVEKIDAFLNQDKNKKEVNLEELVDIDEYVTQRLASGELMESIVDDLKSRGVDLVSRTLEKSLQQESYIDGLLENSSNRFTKEHLKRKYAMNDDEIRIIQQKVKLKSQNNITVGILLIIIGVAFLLLGGLSSVRHIIFLVTIILSGIFSLISGLEKRKSI
ncbi:DUF308 domain-containing protein [Tenacibaculum jejuense]|uniref:Uncharacterized protein n=1 Tax=Tenacibaculum jejuense TaxID=584609 RepID=A0A238UBF9_9FLAO|nr:DUF308 domain-containing protein [Tenacibaculum jejuense]SNR15750.1 Probable transmembrane protein of unknown function [Tenacibaculum jejuense]